MESKKKLKILILSWRGPGHPNEGGAEKSTHEHAKGWVKAGHSVTVFTSFYAGAAVEEIMDGINIIRRGSEVFGVQIEAFKWYLFTDHPKFDLVIDQFHGIPFFTPLFVKEKKLAFIHEVAKEVWMLNPWPRPLNLIPAFAGWMFEPLIFKLFYRKVPFMTVSQSTQEDLVNWGILQSNITVIHNGLDLPRLNHSFSKEKHKTLVFLGALTKDKGIEEALRVFYVLHGISSDWQFWIVGKGEASYFEKLRRYALRLKIDKKIKFWGFVSEIKKFELLSRAHILVNPSVREGWGLVVIEAAAVGTPTAAFKVPGLRDSIIDNKTGIIDKQHSINSMASEIMDLLSDNDRYQRMSKEAIKWGKKFSWKRSSEQSLTLIDKIISS